MDGRYFGFVAVTSHENEMMRLCKIYSNELVRMRLLGKWQPLVEPDKLFFFIFVQKFIY